MKGRANPELRIALIGYGQWTRSAYVPALHRDGRAQVVAVVAPSDPSQAAARAELGSDILLAKSFEDVPDSAELDGIMIAVPDAMHETTLTTALGRRSAVLYEPPLTDRRANIERMIGRLLASELVTYADLELGFIPAVRRLAEIVRHGTLGLIQNVTIRLRSNWGPVRDYDLCNINHLCTWYVDVLNRILDSKPRRVLVLDGHGVPGRRQSYNIAHFDYEAARGTLEVNIANIGDLNICVEIVGSDGDARADLLTGDLEWRARSKPTGIREKHAARQPYASWPGMNECVSEFLNAVQRGHAEVNDASSIALLHRIGLAAEESLDCGGWATVHYHETH